MQFLYTRLRVSGLITANGLALGAVADLEAQNCQPARMPIEAVYLT